MFYSPEYTELIIDGVEITGLAEDGIVFEEDNGTNSHKLGLNGEKVIESQGFRHGTFKINLLQTSDSNSYLNSLLIAQKKLGKPLVITLKNTQTGEKVVGHDGHISAAPSMGQAKESTNKTWEVHAVVDTTHGGTLQSIEQASSVIGQAGSLVNILG